MRTVIGSTFLFTALAASITLLFEGPLEFAAYQLLLLTMAGFALRRARWEDLEGADSRWRWWSRRRDSADPPQLERIDRLVTFGKTTAFDAEWRLLPFLREIATERLEARHGLDWEHQPRIVSELLGAEAWDLLRPDRPLPDDRTAPGLEAEALEVAVAAIERL